MRDYSRRWFHDAASALAHSIAQCHAPAHQEDFAPPYNDLTRFVLAQHARMPDYLRTPMVAATLLFDVCGWFKGGGCFHALSPELRATQVLDWKRSKLGFRRDLIRYHESLATLGLFSRREIAKRSEPLTVPGSVIAAPSQKLSREIVVVGSGPGGAITACLLAEAGREVLLVEEGPFYALDSCEPFSRDEMVQKYRNGGQTVALGRNKVAYVEGRCVGGGSEINSGLYHRTPADILERWRQEFQVADLSERDLLPHFEACERDVSVSLLKGEAPPASLKLHNGALRLGWKSLEVPRWFLQEPAHPHLGKRQSMTQTFVPRFLRAGGKLLPDTRIDSIRQEAGKWILQARHHSAGVVEITTGTLFICAGAIQTPTLLRRSGITHNVGNSLHLHPTAKVVAEFHDSVNSLEMGVPVHQVKEFAPRISFGCSISNPPYLALGLLDHPVEVARVPAAWRRMANYYTMITGDGVGSVRSLPRFRDPLVRYGLTPNDRRDLSEGLRKLAELLFAAGAVALYPSITRGPKLTRLEELTRLPNAVPDQLTNLMTIHLFSSCPMGEDKSKCATDSFGRVHGLKHLHIGDASLLCTAPGVNPQGSVMALARRNVLRFLSSS